MTTPLPISLLMKKEKVELDISQLGKNGGGGKDAAVSGKG